MKGVLLAGGMGSRLTPLTKVTNKHLLPVGMVPMINYPISTLKEAGITDIMVVTGREHMGSMMEYLGSGDGFDCDFTFKVQDVAGGIAQALLMCENFVGDSLCCVILGDNIFKFDKSDEVGAIRYQFEHDAEDTGRLIGNICLYPTTEPERFGVAEIQENHLVSLEEKPKNPKSNLCVTGLYFYSPEIFPILRQLKPSQRGELEITDANVKLLEMGRLGYTKVSGFWSDAGCPSSYTYCNSLFKEKS